MPNRTKQARQKLATLEKKFGKKPNILIFIMDDVGWMDPGFNGGGEAVGNPTPNMDRLAQAGLILTSAYSTPSCTPTRATIHLGQNPLHHGLLRPPMYGEPGGLDGAVTVATVLQKLGYVTQGVGKWHMGENEGSLPQKRWVRRFLRLPRRFRHVHRMARHLLQPGDRAEPFSLRHDAEAPVQPQQRPLREREEGR